jgi:hypothetical protein
MEEDLRWEQEFPSRPYAAGRSYDEFRPAYRYGYESGLHHRLPVITLSTPTR